MKILVIDNYDSFTYNLVYMFRNHKKVTGTTVLRNDKVDIDEIKVFDKIILSPGPGIPSDAGVMPDMLNHYKNSKPILGVCLGHQGMGEAFGCELENMDEVFHGIEEEINVNVDEYLFKGMGSRISCGRYHSWRIRKSSLKEPLEVIATDDNGEIMAIRHKVFDLRGLQFHPESIMTRQGGEIINNWIKN